MEFADLNLDTLMIGPLFLLMLAVAGLTWLAMLGASLKFSIEIFVNDGPRYWVCLLASLLLIGINVGVFVGLFWAVGPQPWYIVSAYQALSQVLLVMLLARCNPVSAFLAALTHGTISSVGTVVIIFVLFFAQFYATNNAIERSKKVADQPAAEVPARTVPAFNASGAAVPIPANVSTNPFVD